jgi:hypothetical protein
MLSHVDLDTSIQRKDFNDTVALIIETKSFIDSC